MNKKTVVVAVGGNALLRRGQPLECDVQRDNIKVAAKAIAALQEEYNVVLVHGNGPQVGLLALQNAAYDKVQPYPLDVLVAESQGMIGIMLQQEIAKLVDAPVVTLLTQTIVDRADSAFLNPTKYVGAVYTKEEADQIAYDKGWTFKQDQQYWRRVVPSPAPAGIVEAREIATLASTGCVVIAVGGGGVPVDVDGNGVEAVVDKDLASALLAKQINADAYMILTDGNGVFLNWGTPEQVHCPVLNEAEITPEFLATFDAGSMRPKIAACVDYVRHTGGVVGIGDLNDGVEILNGTRGTLITR